MREIWTTITLAGKPVDVLMPPEARSAVLFLHPVGLESPAANDAFTSAFLRHRLAVVSPYGARSWWTNRICPEFDDKMTAEAFLLDHVDPWIRTRVSRVATAGISMGGQGALRLAFQHPDRFPVCGSVAGAFDFYEWYGQGTPLDEMYRSREHCRQDTAILHIHPHRFPPHVWFVCDPDDEMWYRGNDRLREKLTAIGLAHTADLETRAGGHTWAYFDHMAEPLAAFLATSQDRLARTLI